MGTLSRPIRIFLCYAREDALLLRELEKQLKLLQRQGLIEVWHDREISPGTNWEQEIARYLNAADIILLLVSPDFINSDYCYGVEMQRAMQRHQAGQVLVIPIILRPVDWKAAPFGRLQALPTDAKPVTSGWQSREEAFYDVAENIRKIVEKMVGSDEDVASKPASPGVPLVEDVASKSVTPPAPILEEQRPVNSSLDKQDRQMPVAPVRPTKVPFDSSTVASSLFTRKSSSQADKINAAGTELLRYEHLSDRSHSIAWSPDRRRFASCAYDDTVRIRDATTGATLLKITEADVTSSTTLVWSPDGRMIAWDSSLESNVQVRETLSGKLLQRYSHPRATFTINWSPDGRLLVLHNERTVQVCDVTSGNLLQHFEGHSFITCTSFRLPLQRFMSEPPSIEGAYQSGYGGNIWLIASVVKNTSEETDETIQVWEAATGKQWGFASTPASNTQRWKIVPAKWFQPSKESPSSPGSVSVLAWSPKGRLLAAGYTNGEVRIWSVTPNQLSLLQRIEGQSQSIATIAWSPDERLIASSSLAPQQGYDWDTTQPQTIQVWEAATGKPIQQYQGHLHGADMIKWSPDGRLIASVDGTHQIKREVKTVQVWEATTGKLIQQYQGHSYGMNTLEWSPSGYLLASGVLNFAYPPECLEIQVWEAVSGKLRHLYEKFYNRGRPIAWLSDGRLLIVEFNSKALQTESANNDSQNEEVQVWEVVSGKHRSLDRYEGHAEDVHLVAWSFDGRLLASMDKSGTVQIWKTISDGDRQHGSRQLYRFGRYSNSFWTPFMKWLPDGRLLVLGYEEQGGIRVWEAISGKLIQRYEGHIGNNKTYYSSGFSSVVADCSPDGRLIASESRGIVQVWEVTSGQLLHQYEASAATQAQSLEPIPVMSDWNISGTRPTSITSLAWSPDGKLIAYGDSTGMVQVRDIASGQLLQHYDGYFDWTAPYAKVSIIAWSPDGRLIASANENAWGQGQDISDVQVWEARSGKLLYHHNSQSYTYYWHVSRLNWSPDGRMIALRCRQDYESTIQVWEATTGKLLHLYKGDTTCMAWSPNGRLIASSGTDKTVQVWEAATGTLLFTYSEHRSHVSTIAWSPDGAYIVSSGREVHIWRAP